ncbi:MAG: glycerate kinase [Verrucomicrobiota bacterium]|jgi:glycerate kinase|nr:glycerate kinase [Verrucomicrobiota bacterium]
MPLSILIAPDKFKGTLTATQAAQTIARGWKKARPNDHLTLLPISDGGDGFGHLLARRLKVKARVGTSKNPYGSFIDHYWWFCDATKTAIIESAEIIGLVKLQQNFAPNPMHADTTGLGLTLTTVNSGIEKGTGIPKHAIVGIGGSATNDGGFGMARELGWHFLDETGLEIEHWPDLVSLKKITEPNPKEQCLCNLDSITVAVDVQNPLLGPNGCTRVYGPQKGLCRETIPKAEAALTQLANIWKAQTGEDAAGLPGAGSAGGLGFGLHCFAGAVIRPGFELYAETVGLNGLLKEANIVVTGEGTMDRQSIMGKGVGELAKLARTQSCRCLGLAGVVEDRSTLTEQMEDCRALTDLTSLVEAKKNASQWLEKLAQSTAQSII